MTIDDSGGVGIGNMFNQNDVPAGYALAVDGKVLCEEVEVLISSDWPDYVFDADYPLMPLEELERSIRENKHLPGMPSAADVQSDGLALGSAQAKLLEKIEELTLYVIDLNKDLETVKADNARFRQRLDPARGD